MALRFDIFPDGEGAAVARTMVSNVVDQHAGHAFVGIHGGRPLYAQLSKYNHDEVAFGALRQTNWPSFGYALANGLTTWPEALLEIKPDAELTGRNRSLNHPMQSGFAVWFHQSVGGIKPAAPGFKRIALEPHGFNRLAWAKAEHDSPYGPIRSDWRSGDGKFDWEISIPANTTATVSVPTQAADSVRESGRAAGTSAGVKFLHFENGRAVYEVVSGNYEFKSKL